MEEKAEQKDMFLRIAAGNHEIEGEIECAHLPTFFGYVVS